MLLSKPRTTMSYMDRPDPLRGRRPLRRPTLLTLSLAPEAQPFPCHPRMPAMLIVDTDISLQYWNYPCQARGCDYVYRFTKQDGWLSWEPIDDYTDPGLSARGANPWTASP